MNLNISKEDFANNLSDVLKENWLELQDLIYYPEGKDTSKYTAPVNSLAEYINSVPNASFIPLLANGYCGQVRGMSEVIWSLMDVLEVPEGRLVTCRRDLRQYHTAVTAACDDKDWVWGVAIDPTSQNLLSNFLRSYKPQLFSLLESRFSSIPKFGYTKLPFKVTEHFGMDILVLQVGDRKLEILL